MEPEILNELRDRLTSIEAELRIVRSALERYAPAPEIKREVNERPSLDNLGIAGNDLSEFLADPLLNSLPEAVDRFLGILGFLHQLDNEAFSKVREIRGRKRIYFSTSKHEIEASGRATMPRQIPGSSWFVVTNNSTEGKVELIMKVCRLLGHPEETCISAASLIDPNAALDFDLRTFSTAEDDDPLKI